MKEQTEILLEQPDLARVIGRMAHEILEKCATANELVLIGIRSRGVHLARRLARRIEEIHKIAPAVAAIDVSTYRDDRMPERGSEMDDPFILETSVADKIVILIDDVIFRGRTIRAAMEAVERAGQPKRILVAALIDRGARELPIRADIVGKNIDAQDFQRINVMLEESDGIDQVTIGHWRGRTN